MKKVIAFVSIFLIIFCTITIYNTTNASQEGTNNTLTSSSTASTSLVELKDKALSSLEDYKREYGDDTYGFAAYALNIIRIYSIPFGFIGIVIAAIYRYVIGIRRLDVQDKGFGVLVAIITVMVICQVLPLIFAIVVKGWRG